MLDKLALLLVMQGPAALSLVPTITFMSCLTNPLDLVPDPEDCHVFYQCDLNPQPMSCGDMMFNSLRQVCDWPSTVLQLRPECRQEDQFRFSGQEFPYYRTLRMLRFLGDGDQFSQKRLRAPQDVGLGRRRIFGNRDHFKEEQRNNIEDAARYVKYEDEKDEIIGNKEEHFKIAEDHTRTINDAYRSNLNIDINEQVLKEIRRRLPLIVQNSLSNFVMERNSNKQQQLNNQVNQLQPSSTPADTIRLQTQKVLIPAAPQTFRPKPTPYSQLQPDSAFTSPPEGPSFVFQQVYPGQKTIPALTSHPAPIQVQSVTALNPSVPAEGPISLPPTVPEIAPADTVILGTKHIPQHQNNGQALLSTHNQPKLAPILVEDTRDFKPVWTVTRERPRQILLRYRQNRHQADCAGRNCPRLRQRVLRKIKRKLIAGEKNQLQERRKELSQGTKAAQESNRNLQRNIEESLAMDERKAVTLKEAYDRSIRKVDQIGKNTRPVPGNLLQEILNRDFGSKNKNNYGEYGSHKYVNSEDLRTEVPRGENVNGLED